MHRSKLWLQAALWLGMVVPGAFGALIFGYYALLDWAALQTAYRHFEQLAQHSADMSALFVAEAMQNAHRINLFAEGVWTLLSAILMSIGIIGMCLMSKSRLDSREKTI